MRGGDIIKRPFYMAKRHDFSNWFYSITKQKILLETNKMASKLLFLYTVKVFELLN
jgi:hypothetical protein